MKDMADEARIQNIENQLSIAVGAIVTLQSEIEDLKDRFNQLIDQINSNAKAK